jgi:hypothetical protein
VSYSAYESPYDSVHNLYTKGLGFLLFFQQLLFNTFQEKSVDNGEPPLAMPQQWRIAVKDNKAEKISCSKGNLFYCLCSGLVTELLAYIHTIILMCCNKKCSEKGAFYQGNCQLRP